MSLSRRVGWRGRAILLWAILPLAGGWAVAQENGLDTGTEENHSFICDVPMNPETQPTDLAKAMFIASHVGLTTAYAAMDFARQGVPELSDAGSDGMDRIIGRAAGSFSREVLDNDWFSQVVDSDRVWKLDDVMREDIPGICLRQGGKIPIGVKFLGGTDFQKQIVTQHASDWNSALPGFELIFQDGPCNIGVIRVAFSPTGGNRSEIGSRSADRPIDEPTMNLAIVQQGADESEIKRVVQHEFGHALGLLHEHLHVDAPRFEWTEAMYAYFERKNWGRDKIEAAMSLRASPNETCLDFDQTSVMIYPIPSSWTSTGFFATPSEIKEKDRECLRRHYAGSGLVELQRGRLKGMEIGEIP